MLSGVVALPGSLPGDTTSGCSGSLYRLTLQGLSPFPFPASPSFPQLTELTLDLPLKDAELALLLSGCPQLLVLSCTVWQSWQAVLLAARCCPRLLDLAVFLTGNEEQAGDAAFTEGVPDIGGRFLPELIALRLSASRQAGPSFCRLVFTPPAPYCAASRAAAACGTGWLLT